jgi:MFS family permease
MTGLYAGQALGGFGATVAHNWSWQTAFQSFGLIGVIYAIVLILLLSEKRTVAPASEKARSSFSGSGSAAQSLTILLGTTSFWVILFYFATPSFPGWGIKNWLPTLFSDSLKINMSVAGPLSTISIAFSSFIGVIGGGLLADRWIGFNLRGRIYTGAIGLSLTIPALIFIGFGEGLWSIIGGVVLFGVGFGMFDSNNMPILCQFVSPGHRAAGYGLMNMTGVFAGALVTKWLGKSTDAGSLGPDLALLAIPVAAAIALQLLVLKPGVADRIED